ncbi:Unknown protein, partial [Striga hermonthica]
RESDHPRATLVALHHMQPRLFLWLFFLSSLLNFQHKNFLTLALVAWRKFLVASKAQAFFSSPLYIILRQPSVVASGACSIADCCLDLGLWERIVDRDARAPSVRAPLARSGPAHCREMILVQSRCFHGSP